MSLRSEAEDMKYTAKYTAGGLTYGPVLCDPNAKGASNEQCTNPHWPLHGSDTLVQPYLFICASSYLQYTRLYAAR